MSESGIVLYANKAPIMQPTEKIFMILGSTEAVTLLFFFTSLVAAITVLAVAAWLYFSMSRPQKGHSANSSVPVKEHWGQWMVFFITFTAGISMLMTWPRHLHRGPQ